MFYGYKYHFNHANELPGFAHAELASTPGESQSFLIYNFRFPKKKRRIPNPEKNAIYQIKECAEVDGYTEDEIHHSVSTEEKNPDNLSRDSESERRVAH